MGVCAAADERALFRCPFRANLPAVKPKTKSIARHVAVVCACLFLASPVLAGTVKLRNERITTPAKVARPTAGKSVAPHTGLFLIQFEGPVQAAWSETLRDRGVTLVRYVPDHAFIARAQGVVLESLLDLEFIRWTGPFRPEHKVQAGLAQPKHALAPDDVAVAVLLAGVIS